MPRERESLFNWGDVSRQSREITRTFFLSFQNNPDVMSLTDIRDSAARGASAGAFGGAASGGLPGAGLGAAIGAIGGVCGLATVRAFSAAKKVYR